MSTLLPTEYRVRDVVVSPAVVLAPMEGVTDLTFRRVIRSIGGAGLTYTEFIASKAVAGAKRGTKWMRMAQFDADERPVALQIYGKDPATMAEAARVVEDLGATIVDINMGCPSKRVCKSSGGSALMAEPELAVDIVRAVRAAISVPLTVKMRSGFSADHRNAPELAWRCQEEGAEAITIHWRTREDRYGGVRAVDKIRETVDRLSIPVIGNGDVVDIDSAVRMVRDTGCAGVMVGRGAMRNPWALRQIADHFAGLPITTVNASEQERVLLGFLASLRAVFERDKVALGRFKKVANHFTRGLPHGATLLRMAVLTSQTPDAAIVAVRAYFDLLRRYESGDLQAFDAALAAAA
jgi:tRNA-dihydrouridine synthase B